MLSESTDFLCEVISPLEVELWLSHEPLSFERRREGIYRRLQYGESWGELFDCAWFRFSGTVPESEEIAETALRIDVNGELLIVDGAGNPVRALTNLSSEFDPELGTPEKLFVPLGEIGVSGPGTFEVWADGSCNDLFGMVRGNGVLRRAELVRRPAEMIRTCFDSRLREELNLEKPANDAAAVYALGHAHLDLLWLWPLRETRRKGVRTFATALANQKKYPWFVFGASQPQLYEFIEHDAPGIFRKVRQAEKEGRWELLGGMWCEADTHLPCGESLMRQFIYGQRYWREKFGHEVESAWLPDVFGYSASIPQIARLNGIRSILTMKTAWNQFNEFPYSAFIWTGIDGSELLAYALPNGNYNESASVHSVSKCVTKDKQRKVTGVSLMTYGIGDGGAGPGEIHLEMFERITGCPLLPEIRHAPAKAFFRQLQASYDRLPRYHGEIYLELHQGTFTSCEQIKRMNRDYENWRRAMEFFTARLHLPLPEWFEDFEKELLLMQFHDSITGTSIERVYREAEIRHRLWDKKFRDFYGRLSRERFFNPTPVRILKFYEIHGTWMQLDLAPFSSGALSLAPANPAVSADGKNLTIANEEIRVSFAADGTILSWSDLQRKNELLAAPAGLRIYRDNANAWNIDPETYSQPGERPDLLSCRVEQAGPLARCIQEYAYEGSLFQLIYQLMPGMTYCEVLFRGTWNTPRRLMRFELPVRKKSRRARYGTQFGYKEYPAADSSSLGRARYEIAAQRWCRLGDEKSAISLASDCKYGFSIRNSQLNLTILRSAERPRAFIRRLDSAGADGSGFNDIGEHRFAFAFALDRGNEHLAADLSEIIDCSPPAMPRDREDIPPLDPGDNPDFSVSMIRHSWRNNGVLLRIYERSGREGRFHSSLPLQETSPDGQELPRTSFLFHPFEIKTFLLREDGPRRGNPQTALSTDRQDEVRTSGKSHLCCRISKQEDIV